MAAAADLSSAFRDRFGVVPRLCRAPGRVNLIGEHTDYNEGLVMPAALDRECRVAVATRTGRVVRVHSANLGETVEIVLDEPPRRSGTWRDYVAGVIFMLVQHGVPLTGADLLLHSDVPAGAGLSSSAALEVAVAVAMLETANATLDRTTIARLCQRAENEVVGARCGIMDQYIACHGRRDTALLIDCRVAQHREIPLPSHLRIVACNSMVRHSVAGGEYNRRREECAAAVARLSQQARGVTSLRDLAVVDLDTARAALDATLFRRVRHIVTENDRVERMAAALVDLRLEHVAALMAESHRSMRDDYEITCAEIDTLVAIAGALPGVHGSRMTGGGFGGCTVHLVDENAVASFTRAVASGYEGQTGIRPEIYVSSAADGAGRIDA